MRENGNVLVRLLFLQEAGAPAKAAKDPHLEESSFSGEEQSRSRSGRSSIVKLLL